MSGNPWSAVTAGVSSGLTFVVKICEVTYALRAVDQQTREYLITAQHVSSNIKTCRELLSHHQDQLPLSERRDYERVIEETKRAAEEVALLLEPARVDLEADCKIHFSTRVMWVLSDNSNVAAALKRLNVVHTTLTQNISTLRVLTSCGTAGLTPTRSKERPPSYDTSQLLQWKCLSRMTPQPSTEDLQTQQTDYQNTKSAMASQLSAEDSQTQQTDYQNTKSAMASPPKELPPELPAEVPAQYANHVMTQAKALYHGNVASDTSTLFEVPGWNDGGTITRPYEPTTGADEYKPRTWLEYQAMKSSMLRERRERRSRV